MERTESKSWSYQKIKMISYSTKKRLDCDDFIGLGDVGHYLDTKLNISFAVLKYGFQIDWLINWLPDLRRIQQRYKHKLINLKLS